MFSFGAAVIFLNMHFAKIVLNSFIFRYLVRSKYCCLEQKKIYGAFKKKQKNKYDYSKKCSEYVLVLMTFKKKKKKKNPNKLK